MENTNLFDGQMFIVPNSLLIRTPFDPEYTWRNTNKLFGDTSGQPHVEVWTVSPDCDNWQKHNPADPKKKGFPSHIPVALFEGKKEGDIIEISGLKIRLNQTEFRYRNFGNFEEVLEKLKQNSKKDPDYIYGEKQSKYVADLATH